MVDLPLLKTLVINSRLNSPWHHVFSYKPERLGKLPHPEWRSVLGWSAVRSGSRIGAYPGDADVFRYSVGDDTCCISGDSQVHAWL